MAVLKLSQIAAAGAAPGATDQVVGVTGGATDNLFSITQIATSVLNTVGMAVGSAKITGGTTGKLLFDNAGALGEATVGTGLSLSGSTLTSTVAPGGSSLTVQYNNATAFGGMSGTSWDDTNRSLTLTGAAVTTSNPVLNLTQTWNAGGVAFTGLKFNVTNSASAVGSTVFDFQLAGNSLLILQPNTNAILSLGDTTTATGLRVYNTVDTLSGPTNYERAVFDWTINANVLTIGTFANGTGTQRAVRLVAANGQIDLYNGSTVKFGNLSDAGSGQLQVGPGAGGVVNVAAALTIQSAMTVGTAIASDTSINRQAVGVLGIDNSNHGSGTTGWYQWAGQLRTTGDVSNATSTLATATGLSVALQASRTYSFRVYLSFTCTAADGIQAAMVASGGLTATDIRYDGYIVDSAANGIKGNAQAAALGTAVASAATTGTAGCVVITGTITVNVAGTINVQFAQGVHSDGNNTTVKRGSYMLIQDMP